MELPPQTPRLKTERLNAAKPADIARAAAILRAGGLVAFPTETVYGLGANALSPEAVEKIFLAKQRPHWDPLIVHIATLEMLAQVALLASEAPPPSSAPPQNGHPERNLARTLRQMESKSLSRAKRGNPDAAHPAATVTPFPTSDSLRHLESPTILRLIEEFWPGPLTLLLPRTPAIPDAVTANRPLVGVRMPNHPVALELIRQTGLPIAAPSANLFGHTSPTTASHVLADLDGRIDAVLDGGPTTVGLESTVAGFEDGDLIVYRPGAITPAMLSDAAAVQASPYQLSATELSADRSGFSNQGHASPGLDLRHYAPRARLILVDHESADSLPNSLVEAINRAHNGTATIGVLLPDGWNPSSAQLIYEWGDWRDGETLARRLFAGLRSLDDRGATIILAPIPTVPGIGEAIRDRLQKAARP